ncbi:MAG: flagellar protein FliT [Methylovulum sp.]|nr:flagellar protein FliT [Methylovulum sp.]
MMTDKAIELQQLITMSRFMLDKAKEDAWDELPVLEENRRALIRAFFLEPVRQVDTKIVSEGIQAILSIDNDIMALGVIKKLEIGQELQKMDQGKKAVKAYTS